MLHTKIARLFKKLPFLRYKNGGRMRCTKWNKQRNMNVSFRNMPVQCYNMHLMKMIFNVIMIASHEPEKNSGKTLCPCARHEEHEGFLGKIGEVILMLSRVIVIISAAVSVAVLFVMTRSMPPDTFPIILRKIIEFLGPTFIKFGQWMSTRKDLFPEELCDSLAQLQRDVSPHSWMYTKHLLNSTYGPNWRDIFVEFDEKAPIGSGCCAQVYKAWIDPDARMKRSQEYPLSRLLQTIEYLKMGNFLSKIIEANTFNNDDMKLRDSRNERKKLQPVAVKVLHPGIKSQIKRDLRIMRFLCTVATFVVPKLHWLSLTDCIDEFSAIMQNQVDMRMEAMNLMKFAENFSEKDEIEFPRPYMEFTDSCILVESFHEGSPISNYVNLCNNTDVQKKLAKIGITMILKMVFKDNFIHCDLHPGNILVQEVKKEGSTLLRSLRKFFSPDLLENDHRLLVLDCGLVVSLNDRCRQNLQCVFRSVLMGNGELAAEYILLHSSSQLTSDAEGFKVAIGQIVANHLKTHGTLSDVNVSTVVSELFSAMVRHRVKQDGSFSSVILSMVVIEGLGRSLDPNIDIFAQVLPFLFSNKIHTCEEIAN